MLSPADCGTWHGRQNPGPQPAEKSPIAISTVNYRCGFSNAFDGSNFRLSCRSSGLEYSLDTVQWSSQASCEGSCQGSGSAMRRCVVTGRRFRGANNSRDRIIGRYLDGSEGHGHEQCRGVRQVEGR